MFKWINPSLDVMMYVCIFTLLTLWLSETSNSQKKQQIDTKHENIAELLIYVVKHIKTLSFFIVGFYGVQNISIHL